MGRVRELDADEAAGPDSLAAGSAAGDLVRRSVLVTGLDHEVGLSPWAAAAVREADLVVGAARHLAAVPLPPNGPRMVLGPLAPAVDRIGQEVAAGRRVVVLASGDPGLFGIVRRLSQAGLPLHVVPAVSSISLAFARAGLAWDGAAVVSAHGRDLRPALNACRALPLVAVLTQPGAGATELGAGLVGWARRLLVAENLGADGERLTWVSPDEAAHRDWADPHVVLVLSEPADPEPAGPEPADSEDASPARAVAGVRVDNQPAAAPAGGWALPESAYDHRDSMITKSEVRSWVLASLRPRLGRLVWDLGAGSGSVGIECALLGAAVVAVEKDAAGCDLVRDNASRHGVDVRVVTGTAPQVLATLPDPDAVFVGGGGLEVVTAVAQRPAQVGPARIVVALAAVDRVGPVVEILRRNGFTTDGVQLSASRFSDLPGGSLRLSATNPVFVVSAERGQGWGPADPAGRAGSAGLAHQAGGS
ncbi:precorrin-6y C5,15-methyltransferase (decarboxylating) subunit CbiE [Kineosporia sp. R_H_3]|uniref:precorrin-6y C5,15-methyltransferase (decarboxylating) subunit CbiE n=1 Tax=Kineosporia sp. R_H_3 TaxID=1961848 RepID=UPI000B4AB940